MNFKKIISIKSINFRKVFRISLSSCLAILIAGAIGLRYSATAGIIAFLSTQDTKRETIVDIIMRCLSYILSVALSFVCFKLLGYNPFAFGLFMFLIVAISYFFGWESVLSSSAVVSTHYMLEGSHSPEFLVNEMLLLLIGVATTGLMNIFIHDNSKDINQNIHSIENHFQDTFMEMSRSILTLDKSNLDREKLESLRAQLERYHIKAIENINNDVYSASNYYLNYMEFRMAQLDCISRIIDNMHALTNLPFNAQELSAFMVLAAENMHIRANTDSLLEDYDKLNVQFDAFPIPTTRASFENLANIQNILKEIENFIQYKVDFIESLSEQQIQRFWADRSKDAANVTASV